MQKFIQAAKQRAKLFSENCNLQNFSGFDVTAILFHDIFFFVRLCRFGFCGKCNAFWSVLYLTYKNSYEVTYVPPKKYD